MPRKYRKTGGPKPIKVIGCTRCEAQFAEIKTAIDFICKKCGHSMQDSFIEVERKLWQNQGQEPQITQ